MLNKTKKILALVLCLVMVFALVGCSSADGEGSSVIIEYQTNNIYQDANPNGTTNDDQNAQNPSGGNNQNPSGGNNQNPSGGNNNELNKNVNIKDFEGTTVVFATTIKSDQDESGPVVKAFTQKYKIKVEEVLVKDNVNDIAGKVASGVNIDVMRCNSDFPAAMAVLQPLEAAKLDMTDPIWDQSMFDFTTFGGKPYLCNTVGNIWSENSCIIYSKSLLKKAGARTPAEYDAAGKWTLDAFAQIAQKVEAIDEVGSGIRGCWYQGEDVLGSVGCGLYKYENGKFTNGLKDARHREVATKLAKWNKEGFVGTYLQTVANQKCGIQYGLAGWSLKKNGTNKDANWNDIGFYSMPAYKEGEKPMNTAMVKGWGIVRGSSNPVAGGLFLRYYLDCGNYDADSAFISKEAANFFFQNTTGLTMDNFFPQLTRSEGTENLTSFHEYDWEKTFVDGDPAQINQAFDKLSPEVEKAVKIMNTHVTKNIGITG